MNKKRFYIIASTLLFVGIFAGVTQYVGMFDALYAAATNPGHSWSQMECTTDFCIDTANHKVGVGTTSPQTTFDVNGAVKIGESTTCNAGSKGAIKYSGGQVSICNGTSWNFVSSAPYQGESFTDPRDGEVYKTVVIGGKTWMAESLRYLPQYLSPCTQASTAVPYYYLFCSTMSPEQFKANEFYSLFGVAYNFPAAQTACPSGWHLPSNIEWKSLETALGMTPGEISSTASNRGSNSGAGDMLKSVNYWKTGGTTGINSVFFNAYPAGYFAGNTFINDYSAVAFWTSTLYASGQYYARYLTYYGSGIQIGGLQVAYGGFIRCVKD